MGEFSEVSRIEHLTATSAQGVAYDGTYAYLADNTHIYKYNYSTGALVSTHSTATDGTYGSHLGDLACYNGKLYVLADNYPTTPGVIYVMTYDASTLAYQSEQNLTSITPAAGGITFADGYFWVCEDNNLKITQYDTSFSKVADFTADSPSFYGSSHLWNGIEKVGNTFYLNPHEGVFPSNIQAYDFDGTSLTFTGSMSRPCECSQGIAWDSANKRMLLSLRHYNEPHDGIVTSRITPDDGRNGEGSYSYMTGSVTVAVNSYVEQSAVTTTLMVRKGDLVRVDICGIFKSTGGNLRAYMDVASTSPVAATLVNNAPTMRTSLTLTDGITLSQFKIFKANADGMLKFNLYWKITTGTGTIDSPAVHAQIIGRAL